ncbi:MAG TPA: ATP-binding cassette domain-containing protein [Ktedonobacteraceae bacterium]|nr:ATP-binding cassette domain-containing protein [Ktedonobacteraceae bacterium]
MDDTIIETNGLRKTFKSRQSKGSKTQIIEAVKGIDLSVQAGEIFGFLGPNGAGKSTTLRMLTTLIQPTAGQARVVGYDLLKEAGQVRRRIGYVSQAGGADETATARENLMLQARLYRMSRSEAIKRTNELLITLELESFADRLVKTYSGGQRRRLDVALGIVNHPRLLFLDEPTSGLDPQSRAHLWDEVRRLRDQGTTVFLTTHYLEEADVLADHLAIMDDGRIVAEGTPDDLKRLIAGDVITLGLETQDSHYQKIQNILQRQSFVREMHRSDDEVQLYVERGEENLAEIIRLVDGVGLRIRKVALARPSLDDVFLRKTGRSLRDSGL